MMPGKREQRTSTFMMMIMKGTTPLMISAMVSYAQLLGCRSFEDENGHGHGRRLEGYMWDPLGHQDLLQNDEVPALFCQGVSGTLLWFSRRPHEHRLYPLHHTDTAALAEQR